MSTTPRTDAAWRYPSSYDPNAAIVSVVFARQLETELAAALAELEREQMRLAVCGVVAISDTPESAKKARDILPEYVSGSMRDVERRVDECIKLRADNAKLREALRPLAKVWDDLDVAIQEAIINNPDVTAMFYARRASEALAEKGQS